MEIDFNDPENYIYLALAGGLLVFVGVLCSCCKPKAISLGLGGFGSFVLGCALAVLTLLQFDYYPVTPPVISLQVEYGSGKLLEEPPFVPPGKKVIYSYWSSSIGSPNAPKKGP